MMTLDFSFLLMGSTELYPQLAWHRESLKPLRSHSGKSSVSRGAIDWTITAVMAVWASDVNKELYARLKGLRLVQ